MRAPEADQPTPPDARARLRRRGDALPDASIGTVPILWHRAAPDGSLVVADPCRRAPSCVRSRWLGSGQRAH